MVDNVRVDMAVLQAELVGQRAQDFVRADDAAGDERVQRRFVFGLHGVGRGVYLFAGEEPPFDKQLQYIFVITSHC